VLKGTENLPARKTEKNITLAVRKFIWIEKSQQLNPV
jgi:hypothetical protein